MFASLWCIRLLPVIQRQNENAKELTVSCRVIAFAFQ